MAIAAGRSMCIGTDWPNRSFLVSPQGPNPKSAIDSSASVQEHRRNQTKKWARETERIRRERTYLTSGGASASPARLSCSGGAGAAAPRQGEGNARRHYRLLLRRGGAAAGEQLPQQCNLPMPSLARLAPLQLTHRREKRRGERGQEEEEGGKDSWWREQVRGEVGLLRRMGTKAQQLAAGRRVGGGVGCGGVLAVVWVRRGIIGGFTCMSSCLAAAPDSAHSAEQRSARAHAHAPRPRPFSLSHLISPSSLSLSLSLSELVEPAGRTLAADTFSLLL